MGITSGGLPYPEPTDPIADGADAIQDLAEAVDQIKFDKSGGVINGYTQITSVFQSESRIVTGEPVDGQGTDMTNSGLYRGSTTAETAPNIWLRRYGTVEGMSAGTPYIRFVRTLNNTVAGSIVLNASGGVNYATNSDPRLKASIGEIADAAERVQQLGARAFRGYWHADPHRTEWDLYNATDVRDVAPYAVFGEPDAVNDDGNIEPMQVDSMALVPLLFSALAGALDRISTLEVEQSDHTGRIAELEARITALEDPTQ